MHRRFIGLRFLCGLLLGAVSLTATAYVPTVEEMCQIDNAARCELNGSITLFDKPCPPEMKTIQPYRGTQCPPPKVELKTPVQDVLPTKPNPWLPVVALSLLLFAGVVWRIRVNLSKGTSFAMIVARWSMTAILSVAAGLSLARFAFYKSFELMPNKDTFAPGLLALAIGGVTFVVVSAVVGALVQRVFKKSK